MYFRMLMTLAVAGCAASTHPSAEPVDDVPVNSVGSHAIEHPPTAGSGATPEEPVVPAADEGSAGEVAEEEPVQHAGAGGAAGPAPSGPAAMGEAGTSGSTAGATAAGTGGSTAGSFAGAGGTAGGAEAGTAGGDEEEEDERAPCAGDPDAHESNDVAPGAALPAMTGDSAARSIGSTYHSDADTDWFTIPVLERTQTGAVRVVWEIVNAMPVRVSAACIDSAVLSCAGGTLLPGAGGTCNGFARIGEFTVTCAETPGRPAGLRLEIGHQRWERDGGNPDGALVPGPDTSCAPEFLVSYEPAQ